MRKIFLVSLLGILLTSFAGKQTDYFFVNSDKTIKIEFNLNQNKTPVKKKLKLICPS